MKKLISAFVILVCVCSALSAQIQFSAGLGGTYRVDSSTITYKYSDNKKVKYIGPGYNGAALGNYGGFFGFFDAVFAEVDIGLLINRYALDSSLVQSFYTLQFGLLGKYPIYVGGFTLFPLAGFQFCLPLAWKGKEINSGDSVDFFDAPSVPSRFDLSQFWIRFGAGADFDITRNIFVRPSVLWGFRFKDKPERDAKTNFEKNNNPSGKLSYFNRGFEFRLSAGYRF